MGERFTHGSGASRRGIANVHLKIECVIASERSNPFFLYAAKMDCFAEPVIGRAFARPVGSQ